MRIMIPWTLILFLLFANTGLIAQNTVLTKISNAHLSESNYLSNALEISTYRENIGLENPSGAENTKNNSVFKISYLLPGTSTRIPGFIDIGYNVIDGTAGDFESGFKNFAAALMINGDEEDYLIEIFKTRVNNGGIFFDKRNNSIIMLIRSKIHKIRMIAMVEFNGLTTEQKLDFAKDFILKSTAK